MNMRKTLGLIRTRVATMPVVPIVMGNTGNDRDTRRYGRFVV